MPLNLSFAVYVCVCMHVSVCIHVCISACVFACVVLAHVMCIYICIYVHTHFYNKKEMKQIIQTLKKYSLHTKKTPLSINELKGLKNKLI